MQTDKFKLTVYVKLIPSINEVELINLQLINNYYEAY